MKELAKKLVLAVKAIDAVEKRGKNEKQGYGYVKATDVARAVREVLVEQGVAFTYSCGATERWEKQTNSGGTLFFVQLGITVTFTDVESGDTTGPLVGIGWGMDSGDKAIYKAMTGALKYALRMNFLIPDELDPENDSHEQPTRGVTRQSEVHDDGPPIESYASDVQETRQPVKANGKANNKNDATGEAAISEGKAKRFFAIALSKGKNHDDIAFALSQAGLSDIKHCPWKGKTYDNLIAWAEQ